MSKKVQILEATERLLAQHGFEHLSMQLVAKEAEVATGTIYRYFSDKNDLLQQLRLHVLTQCACKLLLGVETRSPDKSEFTKLWKNAWALSLSRDADAINREQFDSLPCSNNGTQHQIEREIFSALDGFFRQGKAQDLFKPLPCEVLSSIGLEPALCLARKQAKGMIDLDALALNQVIDACWDAITLK